MPTLEGEFDVEDLLLLADPAESSTPPVPQEHLVEYELAVQDALQGLRNLIFVRSFAFRNENGPFSAPFSPFSL